MDIYYHIGLFADFKTSVNILATCKELFDKRRHFYNEKSLLLYNKPLLPIWTYEQSFYATDKEFVVFAEPHTGELAISYLYENNNTVKHMASDDLFTYEYSLKIYLEKPYLLLYIASKQNSIFIPYGIRKLDHIFYDSKEQFDAFKLTADECQYVLVDLNQIMPVWTKYDSKPKIDGYSGYIWEQKGIRRHDYF